MDPLPSGGRRPTSRSIAAARVTSAALLVVGIATLGAAIAVIAVHGMFLTGLLLFLAGIVVIAARPDLALLVAHGRRRRDPRGGGAAGAGDPSSAYWGIGGSLGSGYCGGSGDTIGGGNCP